jgi:hypothetical protein
VQKEAGRIMTGRPPKPIEQKKLIGTYRPGRTLLDANSTELERAIELPQPLQPLSEAGLNFWGSVWGAGVNWISPKTDIHLVQLVAEQFDERAKLRNLVETGGVPRDRSGLRELEKQITGNLAALGLNPSDRARLGFAVVKTESKLEAFFRSVESRRAEES